MADDSLRIALVAPAAAAVRHDAGGSIEQLVWQLSEGLLDRGHDVTLFATGSSHTRARVSARHARGYDEEDGPWEWQLAECLHAADAFTPEARFDVVHCHTPYGLPFAGTHGAATVFTHHVELGPEVIDAHRRLPGVHVVCPSAHQAAPLARETPTHVIPHGVAVDDFPFQAHPGRYLLFLGRLIADKGPLQALEVARRAGRSLVLAGPADEDVAEHVLAIADGQDAHYVGAVGHDERNRLLAGAAALIYPLQYPEPFGLVVIEALACGTPVLARSVGAVPELIEPGVTGYLADSPSELAALVDPTAALDRRAIRARAERRFALSRMVDAHEALYRRVAARGRAA